MPALHVLALLVASKRLLALAVSALDRHGIAVEDMHELDQGILVSHSANSGRPAFAAASGENVVLFQVFFLKNKYELERKTFLD